jgi:hypothetical protein
VRQHDTERFNIKKQSAHDTLKAMEHKQVLFNSRGMYKPISTTIP